MASNVALTQPINANPIVRQYDPQNVKIAIPWDSRRFMQSSYDLYLKGMRCNHTCVLVLSILLLIISCTYVATINENGCSNYRDVCLLIPKAPNIIFIILGIICFFISAFSLGAISGVASSKFNRRKLTIFFHFGWIVAIFIFLFSVSQLIMYLKSTGVFFFLLIPFLCPCWIGCCIGLTQMFNLARHQYTILENYEQFVISTDMSHLSMVQNVSVQPPNMMGAPLQLYQPIQLQPTYPHVQPVPMYPQPVQAQVYTSQPFQAPVYTAPPPDYSAQPPAYSDNPQK